MNDAHREQTKRWGASTAELFAAFVRIFSERPDVRVVTDRRGPAVDVTDLLEAEELPPAVLAWYRDVGPLEFTWNFVSEAESTKTHDSDALNQAAPGGRFLIPAFGAVSPISEEEGKSPSGIFIACGDEAEPAAWPSLEDYVTEGARAGFTRQAELAVETSCFAELREASVPRFSSRGDLGACLESRGLSPSEAKALLAWLGEDAQLLLHWSATEEGRRRAALMKSAPRFEGEVDVTLIDQLNHGAPLDQEAWSILLAAHQRFLDAGGGGGSWERDTSSILPRCLYRPPSTDESSPARRSQAVLRLENLTKVKCDRVKLPHADLSGVRAEGVNFSKSDYSHGTWIYARLDRANFQGADLSGCDFSRCRLAGADFRKANLSGTSFEGANLSGANFQGATVVGTKFGGAIVRGIRY